jgi:predicted transposase/invertase (TIGR01784 family)
LDVNVKTLEQAQEKLRQAVSLGKHDEADYWRDWIKGYEEGIAIGEERGEARGELKKAREMARCLLRSNIDINIIAASSGLPVEEIESLKGK